LGRIWEKGECFDKLQTSYVTLSKEIINKKASANQYVEVVERYEGLMTEMKFNQDKINKINERMFAEIKNLHRPPIPLQHVIIGCLFLLGLRFEASYKSKSSRKKLSIRELWKGCKKYLVSEIGLQIRLQKINYWTLKKENVDRTREFVEEHKESFVKKRIRYVSRVGEVMAEIVLNMLEVHGLLAGYGDIEEVHRKKDALLSQISSLEKRNSDIASRLMELKQISSDSILEERHFNQAKPESAVEIFLAKLDKLVDSQKAAVEELQRINHQLAETDYTEDHLTDSPLSTCETEDLDDLSSLTEIR